MSLGMLIYTNTKSTKKKQKPNAEREQYLAWLRSVNPSGQKYKPEFKPLTTPRANLRPGADHSSIKSLDAVVKGAMAKTSIMDPFNLRKESADVQEAIIAKSKRIAIAYNKGGYQYMTDETDPTTLGSSERRK
jgi:hypothetical protein